jgi:hypothetical protein
MNTIITVAEKEIGYSEFPACSNETRYGKWFGVNGKPWCGIFVSWVYYKAGFPLEKIGYLKGYAGCQTAIAYFKKTKQMTNTPRPGDIVFFDFDGNGKYDHTGIFVKYIDELHCETIEGNTSLASQRNGGEVMRRKRLLQGTLFVHPAVLDANLSS